MEALRHPNVVMFLGACTRNPQTLAIVLEYCSNGTLYSLLQDRKKELTLSEKIDLAIGVAKGMYYLHSNPTPVLHRDLKSLNVLLDKNNTPKIADYGWTRLMAEKMTGKVGTFQWMAPEVIKCETYTEKADVYSFGIVLWEIYTREPPFNSMTGVQVSVAVAENGLRPTIPSDCPKQLAQLMQICWDVNPNKRLAFSEILAELKILKTKLCEPSS